MASIFYENTFNRLQSEDGDCWKPRTLSELEGSNQDTVVRIFTDGVYDLFHPGHVNQLYQAKTAFPNVYLIVAVCKDEDVLKYKGCLPIMSTEERIQMVKQCKYVDEVMASPMYWPTIELLNELKVDLMSHDALPYQAPDADDCFAPFKEADRFLATERTPKVSTTGILDRILENIDAIKQRQAYRKA